MFPLYPPVKIQSFSHGDYQDPQGNAGANNVQGDAVSDAAPKSGQKWTNKKRQRSDDSMWSSEKQNMKGILVIADRDLIVVIDSLTAGKNAVTEDQANLIKFEIAKKILEQEPEMYCPIFEFDEFRFGSFRIFCVDAASKDWLLSTDLNGSFEGATLRKRIKSQIPKTTKVRGDFLVPKQVDQSFVLGLLQRQNKELLVDQWRVVKFEEMSKEKVSMPATGTGYVVVLEIDDASAAKMEEDGHLWVYFLTSEVTLEKHHTGWQAPKKVKNKTISHGS